MALGRRIGRTAFALATVLGLALWVVALLLFSQVAEPTDDFASNATPILVINAIGVTVLLALIVNRLVRLVRDYRRFVPGSRLEARVVSLVVIVAATPLAILYIFSVLFISKGIDEWFPVDFDRGLRQAINLTNSAIEVVRDENLRRLIDVADRIGQLPGEQQRVELAGIYGELGASEIAVFSANGMLLDTYTDASESAAPAMLDAVQLEQAHASLPGRARGFALLELVAENRHEVHAAVPLASGAGAGQVLWARFPLDALSNQQILEIEAMADEFGQLQEVKTALEFAFTLSLSLVLLVAILAAVYAAFFVARRLISPIQQLMQGTRAVARGDFDTKVPLAQRDEIGFLVNSFNNMTQRLALARQEAHDSEQRLEEERSKLEVILTRLSTGVVALESDLTIRTANKAAGVILRVDLEAHIGESLVELAREHALLQEFIDVTAAHLVEGRSEWREQITLHGERGNRELVCASTPLPSEGDQGQGVVIVFDDVTALMRAQHEAAWGEVARRLAHEIKNPLTPIQLSAERVRRRYIKEGNEDLELLDRATHTIIQQVDSMKQMVDAFSEYARVPDLKLSALDINSVISEVTELYRHQVPPIEIRMNLEAELPLIEADIGRLRQIMHNLMRNASEAVEESPDARIEITTRLTGKPEGSQVEIVVADNGPGFAAEIIDQAFLPYVTSKARGTGLGLAIVRKLVEEHRGEIHARNNTQGGAKVSILLPISRAGQSGAARRTHERRKRA